MNSKLAFYLHYALRSLRRGGQRTVLATLCIAFGVMSLIALQLVATNLTELIVRDPRALTRGDALLSRPRQMDSKNPAPPQQLTAAQLAQPEALRQQGVLLAYSLTDGGHGDVLTTTGAQPQYDLVRAIGVDPSIFPLVGQVQLQSGANTPRTLAQAIRQPGSAAVSRDTAQRLNVQPGSRVVIGSGSALMPQSLQVTAIIDALPDRNGHAVIYNLETARQLAGLPDVVDEVSVLWGTRGNAKTQLEAAGWEVLEAPTVGEQQAGNNVVQVFSFMLRGAGIFGLLIGGIGVSNTIQVLLARRTLEIAILKTTGYRQRDLLALFGVETAMLGAMGALIGAGLGIVLAIPLVRLMQDLRGGLGPLTVNSLVVAGSVLAGILTTMAFGLNAVVRASGVRPAILLRNQLAPMNSWGARASNVALYLLPGSLFFALSSIIMGSPLLGLEVIGAAAAGFIVLGLALGGAFALAVRLPVSSQSLLSLARNNLKRQSLRLIFALIALWAGVFAIGFAVTIITSVRARAESNREQPTGYNVWVYGSAEHSAAMKAQLASQDVQAVRETYQLPVQIKRSDQIVNSVLEGHTVSDVDVDFHLLEGATWDAAPNALYVPNNFKAAPWNFTVGSAVGVTLANGETQPLRVVGFFSPVEDNYAKLTSAPRILVNRPLALQLNRGNLMVSYAGRAPLAQLAPITQNLAQALPNASVLSRALETDARARVYDTLALFATSVAGLAFVAGAVLIANATSLALLERRREIGILKAVGYSSRKVLQTILLENSLLGVIAGVCGLVSIVIVVAIINVWQPAAKIGLNPPLMLIMAAVAILLALGSAAAVAWQPTQVRPLTVLRTE